ncbi:Fur family transcriptional regulator [Aminiphilus circumscriptus]|uniref:Fur family transcriptional regulator n=1 Tax=Aminiphilus circumscriptus TaxID=290732 RepID=UPI0004785D76|nr:Fur family transcriptional regulator [Aminiphilus circumscriptus]
MTNTVEPYGHIQKTTGEETRHLLDTNGLKATAPRIALVELLSASPRGLSMAEIVASLSKDGIGQATVYRAVALLEKRNLIKCVHGSDGEHRYVRWSSGHVHALVCRSCGRAESFEACGLDVLEKLLAAQTGYVIEGHHVEVYGLCPVCAVGGRNTSSQAEKRACRGRAGEEPESGNNASEAS